MSNQIDAVYYQPLIVTSAPESYADLILNPQDESASYQARQIGPSSSGFSIIPTQTLGENDFAVKTIFSDTPAISSADLTNEYQELGTALNEMTELDDQDDWKIDAPVYDAACYVASELKKLSFPAPKIFTHGPQSVVFSWASNDNNLYLTISSNRLSAFVSTPERIKKRVEFDYSRLPNLVAVLVASVNDDDERPLIFFMTETSSTVSEKLPFKLIR